jgi:hypothetical protein
MTNENIKKSTSCKMCENKGKSSKKESIETVLDQNIY